MLKISGAILCLLGCTGFGTLKIMGWRRDVEHLTHWIFLFQKITSHILYQKETLEESCYRVGQKDRTFPATVLKKIGSRARKEREKEFVQIWKEEMEAWCKENLGNKEITKQLLLFPEYVKEADEQLQTDFMVLYMEELQKEKREMEQRIKEKQKPVMAVSLVAGAMISILLI